jgi:chemotaxis protein methyltransferase CheR
MRTPFETAEPLLQTSQMISAISDFPVQPSALFPPSIGGNTFATHPSAMSLTDQVPSQISPEFSQGTAGTDDQNPPSPLVSHSQEDPYDKAFILYQQGRYREVIGLLGSHPKSQRKGRLSDLLARAYANRGQFEEALIWCDKALAIEMLNPGYHYLRATILQEQEQFDEASKTLRKVLFLDPDFVLAYFALGNLSRQHGRLDEAEKYFENVRNLLASYAPDDVLPESDGITAGRLGDAVNAMV